MHRIGNNPYIKPAVCLIIALIALYLRYDALAGRPLSLDEFIQLNAMRGSFGPFWKHTTYGDHTSFPGEYLLNFPFVRLFDDNKWGLAVPHISMTILGFVLLYICCRRYLSTLFGFATVFILVCFNKNLVYHAFEFRPYAVLPTLALASLCLSEYTVKNYSQLSIIKKILIGLCFFIITNYHAYGILIFLLPAVYTVVSRHKGPLKSPVLSDYIKYFGVIFLLSFPVWCWYASFNTFGMKPNKIQFVWDVFHFIPNPLRDTVGFLKAVVGNLIRNRLCYIFLIGGVALLILSKDRFNQILFLLILVIMPLTLILLMDIKTQYLFIQRQFVWVMPLFAIWLGWCCDSLVIYFSNLKRRP